MTEVLRYEGAHPKPPQTGELRRTPLGRPWLPGRDDHSERRDLPRRRRRAATAVLLGTFLLLSGSASAPTLPVTLNRLTAIAYSIEAGQYQPGWRGGEIPYSWGGGHDRTPGPSFGTCEGYQGSVRPCPATRTRGLDCSGLARWVYQLAYGRDVLGPGNTNDHIRRLTRISAARAQPGDLVFYGKVGTRKFYGKVGARKVRTHHVGVYIGDGKMINALRTGTEIRVDPITAVKGFAGYYRFP